MRLRLLVAGTTTSTAKETKKTRGVCDVLAVTFVSVGEEFVGMTRGFGKG